MASNDYVELSDEVDLGLHQDLLAYNGFDPRIVLSALRNKESNKKILNNDMTIFAVFICNRGTNVSKFKESTTERGVKMITSLMKKYEVVQGTPRDKDAVTIGRIGACIPNVIAEVMKRGHGRVVGESGDCPEFLCFTSAASIIPRAYVNLFKAWKEWRSSFSAVINSSSDKFDNIIHESNFFSEEARHEIMMSLGIKRDI